MKILGYLGNAWTLIMKHEFKDDRTDGSIRLIYNEKNFMIGPFKETEKDTLTIIWNKGENQKIRIDDRGYYFNHGQVIVLNANQAFLSSKTEDLIFWQFNRQFYCIIDHDHEVSCVGLLFYGHEGVPQVDLQQEDQRKLDLLFQVFLDEYAEPDDNLKSEMLRIILKRLIVKLTRLYKQQVQLEGLKDDDMDTIRQFNLLVEKNFKEKHQVQDYSELIHKSSKTISNLFSKYSEKSPLEVIHERILLEAKRMLIYTSKTTKEISFELGFNDIPSFSRFFKKHAHLAPSKYRIHHQGVEIGNIDNP